MQLDMARPKGIPDADHGFKKIRTLVNIQGTRPADLQGFAGGGVQTGSRIITVLPDELERAIAELIAVDDAILWQVARSHMPLDAIERPQELNLKRQREGLTDTEQQESDQLIRQYERSMLVRAQAVALLKQRGHDVSTILVP